GVGGVGAANTDDFAGLGGREKTSLRERPITRGARPLVPRRAGNFLNLFAFDETPKRRAIFWQRRIERGKPAKFHLGSAQVMFWMRYGTLARSPEHRANPGEGRENHI